MPFAGLPFSARWSTLSDPGLLPALWVSLRLALAVGLVSMVSALAALLVARRDGRWVAVLMALPGGVSVLVLGLGVWLAYGRWLDPFEGSWLAMILLQSVLFFPFAFRTLWPLALRVQRRQLEAALVLGASPVRAFLWVEWPRWRGSVLGALAVVLAGSLGEVAAVSLFYSEKLVPLPLLVQRWMGQYRFDEAQALAALLLLLSAGTLWLVKTERELA